MSWFLFTYKGAMHPPNEMRHKSVPCSWVKTHKGEFFHGGQFFSVFGIELRLSTNHVASYCPVPNKENDTNTSRRFFCFQPSQRPEGHRGHFAEKRKQFTSNNRILLVGPLPAFIYYFIDNCMQLIIWISFDSRKSRGVLLDFPVDDWPCAGAKGW